MRGPVIDYRNLRWNKLMTREYRHLFYLLFWPVNGLVFSFLENNYHPRVWHAMSCGLDRLIPFCEWFVIPYLFWFVFLIGMIVYTALYDIEGFRKMSRFIILTYGVTLIVYFFYPNMQHLRPLVFPRDNLLTRVVAYVYATDTDTNVCPSLHVVGSIAAMCAGLHAPRLQKAVWRIAFIVTAFFTSISTVFMKQHSAIDVLMALILSFAAYLVCYGTKKTEPDMERAG